MRFGVADWDGAVDALARADRVVLACHVNPDGDALGSLLGTSLALRRAGKETFASWDGKAVAVPPAYAFLPGADTLVQPRDVPEVDTFVALDCGAEDRLGALAPIAKRASVVVNVDHHPGNDSFGTHNLVVPDASSTAELVSWLLKDLGIDLDRDVATCLYTGLVTDTGRFSYSNATPAALRLAAELLALEVPATDIARDVYESVPFGYLKLLGRVLERARLHPRERFVYSYMTRRDLEETEVPVQETDHLIDALRSTRDAEVSALFKEQVDGKYRVSLRSRGPSVGEIARARGGGGHELAAGFTAPDIEVTVEGLLSDLRNGAA